MAMKEQQKRYIMDRITAIENRLLNRIKEQTVSDTKDDLSEDEKLSLIVSGKARFDVEAVKTALAPGVRSRPYHSTPMVTECFTYPGEEKIRAHNEKITARSITQTEKVRQHARRLKDDVMLRGVTLSAEQLAEFEGIKL